LSYYIPGVGFWWGKQEIEFVPIKKKEEKKIKIRN